MASASTVSPIGFYVATPSALGPPSPLLADNINPKTKDFASLFEGMDPVDARVQVAVTTRRGSGPAVLAVGLRSPARKILPSTPQQLASNMREALRPIVQDRDIYIKNITFGSNAVNAESDNALDPSTQSGQLNIEYVNLRAMDHKTRTLQLSAIPQFEVV